jgi:hypothetical protein
MRIVKYTVLIRMQSGPSVGYAERQSQALERLLQRESQCVACSDKFQAYNTKRLACGHIYCENCLRHLFLQVTKDQALFPSRCCRQEIPLELVNTVLSPDDMETFQNAQIEFTTKDRTYCSNPDCAVFIPPIRVNADRASCGKCDRVTCVHCKGKFHPGDCLEDLDLQVTVKLAEEQGWCRCYSCKSMVELVDGCNHMRYVQKQHYCSSRRISLTKLKLQMWGGILLSMWHGMEELSL